MSLFSTQLWSYMDGETVIILNIILSEPIKFLIIGDAWQQLLIDI